MYMQTNKPSQAFPVNLCYGLGNGGKEKFLHIKINWNNFTEIFLNKMLDSNIIN